MERPDWLNRIYCTDCVEGMRQHLPDGCVDVVVTSPPYNIGVRYNSHKDDMPFADYLDWMGQVAEECCRVMKDDGSFFFNIGDKPSDELRSLQVAQRICESFRLQNTFHWVKSIAAPEKDVNIGHYKPVNSPRYVNNCHEYIFHFTKDGDVSLDKLAIGVPYGDKSNIGRWKQARQDVRDRGNTWFVPYRTVQSEKPHPAAFPVTLPEMCIKLHGVEDGLVVMDPFMGSGTTAFAARGLDCNYVGFEMDAGYVEFARSRLAEPRVRQSKLGF